jgi:nucleoid-associated protein YgaU
MTTKIFSIIATGSLIFALSACSSSPSTDGSDDMPTADAATDEVPSDVTAAADAPPPGDAVAAMPPAAGDVPPSGDVPPMPPAAAPDASAPTNTAATAPMAPIDTAATPPPTTTTAAAEIAPAPTAMSDSAASSGSSTATDGTYTVRRGDTLMKIAFETTGDLYKWKEIYEANRDQIKDPNMIVPGTVLKVGKSDANIARNGEKHEIKQGETLGTISNEVYGTPRKWKQIWHNNKDLIKDPNKIFAGFFLYYTMSPEDKEEQEKLQNNPAPMANGQPDPQSPEQAKPTAMNTVQGGDTRSPASAPMQPMAMAPTSGAPQGGMALAPAPAMAPAQAAPMPKSGS